PLELPRLRELLEPPRLREPDERDDDAFEDERLEDEPFEDEALDDVLRDEDLDDELDDELFRRDDDARLREPVRRSDAGISSCATALVSCGISFSRNFAMRSSSRRMPRAIFAVSLSPTRSAR